MRFKFDPEKSKILKLNKHRGISFEDAKVLFDGPYYLTLKNDDPEQYLAIGWVFGRMFSVVFEIREDKWGEYYHLVTLWKSTSEEEKLYEENC